VDPAGNTAETSRFFLQAPFSLDELRLAQDQLTNFWFAQFVRLAEIAVADARAVSNLRRAIDVRGLMNVPVVSKVWLRSQHSDWWHTFDEYVKQAVLSAADRDFLSCQAAELGAVPEFVRACCE